MTVIGMTSASLFVMWLADQITTFGIGNGASLIIMINITSRLPQALINAWERYFGLGGVKASAPIAELPILILFFLFVVMGTIMLVQGVRKVTIHTTRRSVAGGNTYGMQQTFMPLRVNYTGVMPIIFAQPLIQIPAAILAKITDPTSGGISGKLNAFAQGLANPSNPSVLYIVIYASLIMFFAFFWVATQFNAVDISENLKKDGSYIPGIRPGRATAEYLDDLMTKITLIGGTGLLVVATIPLLLIGWMGVPWAIASFFGGTSLLIIVGVALDTLRIMESHLLVRKYEGFLAHGSLRGRSGM
jgi:preprotein translocase subunit SecY